MKKNPKVKTETTEEYLSRNGQVTKLPPKGLPRWFRKRLKL